MKTKMNFRELQDRLPDNVMLFQFDDWSYVYGGGSAERRSVSGIYVHVNEPAGSSVTLSRLAAPTILRQLIGPSLKVAEAYRGRPCHRLN